MSALRSPSSCVAQNLARCGFARRARSDRRLRGSVPGGKQWRLLLVTLCTMDVVICSAVRGCSRWRTRGFLGFAGVPLRRFGAGALVGVPGALVDVLGARFAWRVSSAVMAPTAKLVTPPRS